MAFETFYVYLQLPQQHFTVIQNLTKRYAVFKSAYTLWGGWDLNQCGGGGGLTEKIWNNGLQRFDSLHHTMFQYMVCLKSYKTWILLNMQTLLCSILWPVHYMFAILLYRQFDFHATMHHHIWRNTSFLYGAERGIWYILFIFQEHSYYNRASFVLDENSELSLKCF